MKTRFTLLIGLLAFCSLNAHSQSVPTVREQMEALNKYWKTVEIQNAVLTERTQLTTDVDLITTHLFFVENNLREKQVDLTEAKLKNRNFCLDVLKEYRERGVYPQHVLRHR